MKQFLASIQLKSESFKSVSSELSYEDRAPQFTHQRHKNGFIAEWETVSGSGFDQIVVTM